MSSFAEWLDTAFAPFDDAIITALHSFAEATGGILTPVTEFYSLIGTKGLLFMFIGVILMLFRKTRKAGICMVGAVGLSAILSNMVLKDMVARIRPYVASETYKSFFDFIGSSFKDEGSFPSGHVTGIAAASFSLVLTHGKKYLWLFAPATLFMMFSRVYLVYHYPTDTIGGVLVGIFSAVVAALITKFIYYVLEKYKDFKFFDFILNFNLPELFGKKESAN